MIIQSKRIWLVGQFVEGQIEIEGGKIKQILPYQTKEVDKDYGDLRIVPGFIDIHTHGAYGFDTNYAKEDGLRNWMKKIPEEGVTGILPTTITQSHDVLSKALKNVAKVYKEGYEGAEILGIHFEGPYLDKKYKGAQPEEAIVQGTIEEFEQYQKDADGLIKVITMACEHDPDFTLTKYLKEKGVVVSLGHSSSTYEQAVMAMANGASSMTHIYNGMSAFNHRTNGMIGAALRFKDVYGECICDGNHSTLAALSILFQSKGRDRVIMITDSLMAKGFPAGSRFMFGGHEIEIYEDGSAHLVETKNLAGSTLKVNQGLKILVEKVGVPFDAALNSCTLNPARLLKVDDRKGLIQAGHDADLVVLEDNYDVLQTYCKGKASL